MSSRRTHTERGGVHEFHPIGAPLVLSILFAIVLDALAKGLRAVTIEITFPDGWRPVVAVTGFAPLAVAALVAGARVLFAAEAHTVADRRLEHERGSPAAELAAARAWGACAVPLVYDPHTDQLVCTRSAP